MKNLSQVITVVFLTLIVVSNSSCGTGNLLHKNRIAKDTTAFRRNADYQYRIKRDDKISLGIWDHDDMGVGSVYGIYNSNEVYGKWLLVDAKGNIPAPQLGTFHIDGLTVMEAEDTLLKLYKKYIVNPILDLKVLNKDVTILGELKTPGKYPMEKDYNTIFDVVSKAGDFDFYADKKHIKVIRNSTTIPTKIDINLCKVDAHFSQNIQIYPGDIIYVPSKKSKSWEKRYGSIIIPITTIISSAVLLKSLSK